MTKTDKEIRGWKEIIIETKDGELIVDITEENYIAKDGYDIRLVPCEDKNLATDAVPVKHGKWIEGELYIRCSECGYPAGHLSDNYCPNCGTKMDKDGEREEK